MDRKEKDNITNIEDYRNSAKHLEIHNTRFEFEFFTVDGMPRAVIVKTVCNDCGDETILNIFSDGSCQGESFAEIMGFRDGIEEEYQDDDCGECFLCDELISELIDCENKDCDECGLCADDDDDDDDDEFYDIFDD